jgi:hypothetical protein
MATVRGFFDRLALYVLDEHRRPRHAASWLEWGEFLENIDGRRVALTTVGTNEVSTVFIGAGCLFETMAFDAEGRALSQARANTWNEAQALHDATVRELREKVVPFKRRKRG